MGGPEKVQKCADIICIMPRDWYYIQKDVAILNLKPFKKFMYHFLSASGIVRLTPIEADTAADSIIWEVFAKISADIHESSQLIH